MTIANVTASHSELKEWEKSILFFADEIRVAENRLEEVVAKNTGTAVLAEIEHFQNQFILQKEQFDILLHEIHEQERRIRADFRNKEKESNEIFSSTQPALRNKIESAGRIFEETKKDFYAFLSKVM